MKTHVCFVSNQLIPSLTPLIDRVWQVKRVILVAAPERLLEAEHLKNALAAYQVQASISRLHDSFDLDACRADLSALAHSLPHGVVANITGGSKVMTIAGWEVFNRPVDELYYVDIREDAVRWLRPERPMHSVGDRVRIEPYLLSLGMRTVGKAERAPVDKDSRQEIQQQLSRLKSLGESPSVTMAGKTGAWLEQFVFDEIGKIRPQDAAIQDVAYGFRVESMRGEHKVENELDAFCLRDNTPYVFECKTGRAGTGTQATDAIYKLAQLIRQMAGIRGRGVFVSSECLTPRIIERATQAGIDVIDRTALFDLKHRLAEIFARRWDG